MSLISFLRHIGKKIYKACYFHIDYIIFDVSLSEPIPRAPVDSRLETRTATMSDLPALKKLVRRDHAKEFKKNFNRGDTCIVTLLEDTIVAYVWVTAQDYYDSYTRRTIHLAPGEGFGYDAYSRPDWRGKGIRTFLQAEERRKCREMGCRRFKFLIDEKVVDRAIRTWKAAGLEQEPVVEWNITNILWFRKDRFTPMEEKQ